MNIKASGRWALIIAAGLWVCLWGPLQATQGVAAPEAGAQSGAKAAPKKTVRHHTRHARRHVSARPAKSGSAKQDADNGADKNNDRISADGGAIIPSTLPASVANANARLAVADATGATPSKPPATANAEIVAADQVNDLDRAAGDPPPAAAPTPQPITVAQVASASNRDGAWDKASLVGKIFIAVGGLLTIASAARLFMA
jgi:hypothetical protein